MEDSLRHCTQCRGVIDPAQAGGLCPVCLLNASLREEEDNTRSIQGIDDEWLANQGLSPGGRDSAVSNRFGEFELGGEIGRGGMGLGLQGQAYHAEPGGGPQHDPGRTGGFAGVFAAIPY